MATAKSSKTSSGKPAASPKQKTTKAADERAEHAEPKSKSGKGKSASSPNASGSALAKPVKVSDQLAKIIGEGPMPRTEVTSKIWAYIRKNELQNPENKREIIADEDLKAVFEKDKVTMFEMTKIVSRHLS